MLPAATLVVVSLLALPSSTTIDERSSVFITDDASDPIEGAVVRLDNGVASEIAVTGPGGQTPWLPIEGRPGLELTITDASANGGIALGLIAQIPTPPLFDTQSDAHYWLIGHSQPVAEPVLISSTAGTMNNILPGSGAHPHWRIGVLPGSRLRVRSHVAPLLDGESVASYLAYRGHPGGTSYTRGTAFVLPHVELGDSGFVVGIDLLGESPTGLAVDALDFYEPSGAPFSVPNDPFAVEFLGVHFGVAYARVTGTIREGHFALLLRPAGSTPEIEHYVPDSPPTIVVPDDAGTDSARSELGEDRVASAPSRHREEGAFHSVPDPGTVRPHSPRVNDCIPQDPNPPAGWTCSGAPPHTGDCQPATEASSPCKTIVLETPTVCKSPGGGFETQTAIVTSFKVKFNLIGSVKPPGAELTSDGGFEIGYSEEQVQVDSWQAQDGSNDLGQCMRMYRFYLNCVTTWTYMEDQVCWIPPDGLWIKPCALSATASTLCSDLIISQNVCDRTP